MELLGGIITDIGLFIILAGAILLIFAAFSESVYWGMSCLFFYPVAVLFLALHYRRAAIPFVIQLAGLAVYMLGKTIAGEALF